MRESFEGFPSGGFDKIYTREMRAWNVEKSGKVNPSRANQKRQSFLL